MGGESDSRVFDEILCFDVESERYTHPDFKDDPDTISDIAGTNHLDPQCPYGKLRQAMTHVGCVLMPPRESEDDDDGNVQQPLIVVGGRDENGAMSRSIEICMNDGSDCEPTGLQLNQFMQNARVVAIDSCRFMVMGGEESGGKVSPLVSVGDWCAGAPYEWLVQDVFPQRMKDFSIIVGNGQLCLYGGEDRSGKVDNELWCTPFRT